MPKLPVHMNNLTQTLRRYPKTVGSIGVLTAVGLIIYKKHHIQQVVSKLLDQPGQDVEGRKRPDYIYIKYHIYRESMRRLQQKEELDKKWISVIINPIGKWWKSFKHSVAWRLLNIAQTGNQHERLKAIRQLACIDHLKDWDFRHLAQICDARTAVSLARSGADPRWFTPVHMRGCIKNPKIVLAGFHDMLDRLRPNSCVNNFFNKYFPVQEPEADIDEFIPLDQSNTFSTLDTDLLKEIISFLHHLTKDEQVAQELLAVGGLTHLMELRKIFSEDNETLATLCKVLANISMVKESVSHFYYSGWIRELAEWQICPDLRLQVISAKTMANLDLDDPNHTLYPPNVYPLHPRQRTRVEPKADIVFIHGLLGGVFITWRQKDRKPKEIGLYGKNAFYTNDTDDIFLVGDGRRTLHTKKKTRTTEKVLENNIADAVQPADSLLKASTKSKHDKTLSISDAATKELVETLQNSAELTADWEVVHPDVPLKANENCCGEFSVCGNEWVNQDRTEDYTNCWPMEWLPDDYPNSRIIGIDYTSAVTEWSANFTKYCPCEKGQGHIEVRAASLLERIAKSDVGKGRPVVWIGHSMGGLLTKIMLMRAIESDDPQIRQVAENTNSIVFLGTPHKGSPIAKWKQHMQMLLSPSIEVKEMEEGCPALLQMHERFMKCLHTTLKNIKIVSIAEGIPTMLTTFKFPLRIVTEESARIDYGDFYMLKDDHLSLSKPIFRQSFLYRRLLQVIGETMQGIDSNPKDENGESQTAANNSQQTKEKSDNSSISYQKIIREILSHIPTVTFKLLFSQ